MGRLRALGTTVVALLFVGAGAALACEVHSVPAPAAHLLRVPTSLDLVFGSRPLVRGTRLLGHADPGDGYSADVYAHGGFAYLSSWRGQNCPGLGVRVYTLRDPRRPRRVATFADAAREPELARTWTEKTIVREVRTPQFRGTLAVTSLQNCDEAAFRGFGLYDVTDAAKPRRLALVRTEPRGSHEIWLEPARGRAWVYTAIVSSELLSAPDYNPVTRTATIPGRPDFRIFDVTDPRVPVQVGEWGSWARLGIHPNGVPARGRYPRSLVHSVITNDAATRAFLSHWDLGTVMLDIRNPAAPRYLGRTAANDREGDAHSTALGRNGRLLIETHETAAGVPVLYDVADARRPRVLGRLVLPEAQRAGKPYYAHSVHDPKIRGNRAYFSWYRQGVVVADIADPRRPRRIAQFVPPSAPDAGGSTCGAGESCTFVWGVFPYRDYVLASDMGSGLWIFRVTERRRSR